MLLHRVRTSVAAVAAVLLGTVFVGTASPSTAVVDRDCSDFASQRAAQIFFLKHGGPRSDPHGLDSEGDGIACESNPAPYYYRRTLPDQAPKPPKTVKVRSTVELSLSRGKAIAGEPVRLTAVVKPRGVRAVVFQRKDGRSWDTVDRDRTTRRGKGVTSLRAPRKDATYRAVVQKKKSGNKVFGADTSRSRDLDVQDQHVRLVLSDDSVREGRPVTATAIATPVRRHRPLVLQVRLDGRWETVARGVEDRRGRETFTVPTDTPDIFDYRAQVLRSDGARAATSLERTLTVRAITPPPDTTPPAVPAGLVATPGDASAHLAWDTVGDDDLAHYVVEYRTSADGAWTVATSTFATATGVEDLVNGTTYTFAVSSVDDAGNTSVRSAEVPVTPGT